MPHPPLTPLSPRAGGPQRSQQLPAAASSYDLGGLEPGRRYHISITSLAGSRESEPATVTAITGKELHGAKGASDPRRRAGAQRGIQGLGCCSRWLGEGDGWGARSGVGAAPWGWHTLSSSSLAAAPGHVTSLRVTDVRRDSVTLTWTPVPGASSYVLSWTPPAGEAGEQPQGRGQCPHGGSPVPLTLSPGWQLGGRQGRPCPVLPAPSRSPDCGWGSATPSPSARSWGARRVPRPLSASARVR